jgi:hypothetical protein
LAEVTEDLSKGKDSAQKVQKFLSWFKDSYRMGQAWRVEALENYSFVEGGDGQWDEKDLRDLEKAGRPHITINKILPQILTLEGLQRANRLDIRALPRGASDTQASDLMSNLIEYVANRSNADYEQSQAFCDGNIAGVGCLEVLRSFDDDLEGELLIRAVDPLQIFPDPDSRRPDWDDARFVMKAPFKDVEEIVFSFAADSPEPASKIRDMAKRMKNDDWLIAFGTDRSMTGNLREELGEVFYDHDTRKVRVLEVHYRTTKRIAVVAAPDGEVMPIESGIKPGESPMDAAEREAKIIGGFAETRKVKVVRLATLLGWELLQDVESPFPTRRFPIIPYMPLLFRRRPYGMVRHWKDPQRELNKRRSQTLHHINVSAHSGWLNDVNGGADPRVLEQFGSTPGVVVNHQGTPPVQIVPHQLPTSLIQMEAKSDEDIREIGVPAELAGEGSQRFISGKAMQTRQFGGQVRLTRFYDQLRLTRKLLGELLVSIIPRMYSERRIREIVDQEVTRAPDGAMASLLEQAGGDLAAAEQGKDPVEELIARARKLRFDIVVDDAPALPTQRAAAFQELVQLASLFPGTIDPDLLIEHSSVKNKDELVARMQQKMQAGMVPQQSARTPGQIEKTDVGDAGQAAQSLMGGQPANSEG